MPPARKGSDVKRHDNAAPHGLRRRQLLDQVSYLVVFLLVGSSIANLLLERTAVCWYTVTVCTIIAVGYWAGLAYSERLGVVGRPLWLSGLVLLWVMLTSTTPGALPYAYIWFAVPLACLAVRTLGQRAALGALIVITAVLCFVLVHASGTLGPDALAGPLTAVWATVGLFQVQQRDARARQRLLDELQDAREELDLRQREAGALAERARIARDLHDTLAQELSGTRMLLQAAERDRLTDPERAWRHVHSVSQALGDHLTETRRIIGDLTPAELRESTLESALRELCDQARRTGVAQRVTFSASVPRQAAIERESATALLRVSQGALANVREHAGAENVLVSLSVEGGELALEVRDDGVGFTPGHTRPACGRGYGLAGLRERMRTSGGTLTIVSSPGQGTLLTAALPASAAFCESESSFEQLDQLGQLSQLGQLDQLDPAALVVAAAAAV